MRQTKLQAKAGDRVRQAGRGSADPLRNGRRAGRPATDTRCGDRGQEPRGSWPTLVSRPFKGTGPRRPRGVARGVRPGDRDGLVRMARWPGSLAGEQRPPTLPGSRGREVTFQAELDDWTKSAQRWFRLAETGHADRGGGGAARGAGGGQGPVAPFLLESSQGALLPRRRRRGRNTGGGAPALER